jgi:hypothetical protein
LAVHAAQALSTQTGEGFWQSLLATHCTHWPALQSPVGHCAVEVQAVQVLLTQIGSGFSQSPLAAHSTHCPLMAHTPAPHSRLLRQPRHTLASQIGDAGVVH